MNTEYSKCKPIFYVMIPQGIKDNFFRNEILNYLKLCLPQEVRVVEDLHTINYCEQYNFIMPNNQCLTAKIWFKDSGYISKVKIDPPVNYVDPSFYWFDNLAHFLKDKLIIGHSGVSFSKVVNCRAPHFIGMPIYQSLELQINLIIERWQSHADNCICSCIEFNEIQNCIELLFSKGLIRSLWNVFYNKNGMLTSYSIKRQCNADEIFSEIQELFENVKSGENNSGIGGEIKYHHECIQPAPQTNTNGAEAQNNATLNPDQNGLIDTSPF